MIILPLILETKLKLMVILMEAGLIVKQYPLFDKYSYV
jgi:hypothetical protein